MSLIFMGYAGNAKENCFPERPCRRFYLTGIFFPYKGILLSNGKAGRKGCITGEWAISDAGVFLCSIADPGGGENIKK